jgi:uncharacterized membrane protein YdjX (TVP38/TMEM64 family)
MRIIIGFLLLATFVLAILFFMYNERILAWLKPLAEKLKNGPGGWIILWGLIFICAFPPMIGYSTCVAIAGFVYGVPIG